MAVVIDGFLAADEARALLEQLPTPLLEEGQERRHLTLDVPLGLERRIQLSLLGNSRRPGPEQPKSHAGGIRVAVAARVATGSVPLHQDCFTPFDAAETNFIDDCVAVVYLSGAGSFVVDDGFGEEAIDVVPGRLVAWHNGACKHRLDARPEGGPRVMLGPMALDADGSLERAHDVWSLHPGYIRAQEYKRFPNEMKEAEEAEARHDDAAVRQAIGRIGVPTIVADRLREYEERRANRPKLVVTLTVEQDPKSWTGGVAVIGTGMDGEQIVTLAIERPRSAKFDSVERRMTDALGRAGWEGAPVFTLPDATLLTEEHHGQTVEALLGKPPGAPAAPAAPVAPTGSEPCSRCSVS